MSSWAGGWFILMSLGCATAQDNRDDLVKTQHEHEDQQWAIRTGLPAGDVRAMRIAAGMSDTSRSRIVDIDTHTLQHGKHILFVEAGPCLKLHVLERGAKGLVEIWSLGELPESMNGAPSVKSQSQGGICPQATRPPRAHATTEGRIILEVPVLTDPFQRSLPPYTYVFAWNGGKYMFIDEMH